MLHGIFLLWVIVLQWIRLGCVEFVVIYIEYGFVGILWDE